MSPKPVISVLLVFHNQRNEAETSLNVLFELEDTPFELIIIDDASTDDTAKAIQALLDSTERKHLTYIGHSRPIGRGRCLNKALQQATSAIVWAPGSIRSINENALHTAIATLRNGSSPCLMRTSALPSSLSEWPARIQKGQLPENGKMLWNTELISPRNIFINPFLAKFHGIEWLFRLGMDILESASNFYLPVRTDNDRGPFISDQKELLFALMRRSGTTGKERKMIANLLADLRANQEQEEAFEDDYLLLEKAVKLKMKGQLSESLEYVEKMLKRQPNNSEAKHLKIKLLEAKRRYVEASELKHQMQHDVKSGYVHRELTPNQIKTSLIIPTMLYGKPALENCLISINKHCNPERTELIIVDNASLDDTYEYILELREKNFFNCRVITNQQNKGFAASVNQALNIARGNYACIMHNDVELQNPAVSQLEKLMDGYPDFALIAPLAEGTQNPKQTISAKKDYKTELVEANYLDSFMIMTRANCDLRLDSSYKMAYFDDIDLCYEARRKGYKVGIAPGASVIHHHGTTTYALGLDTNARQYWKNIIHFNEKWNIQPFSDNELQNKSDFEQLLTLDDWVNPIYPESAIQTKFDELFTEELKTEILASSYDPKTMIKLIRLMMVMGRRDIMRRLEEKMSDENLPAPFLYELIRYYFNHNVYSRCLHYLNKLTDDQESIKSELYRLAILIDEKKMAEAIPLLTALLNKAPSNPMLYKLAGDIHSFEGNQKEATSFYELAEQINPFDFGEKQRSLQV